MGLEVKKQVSFFSLSRVHQNLLCIYGQGVSDDTEYEETKYSCLAMMK